MLKGGACTDQEKAAHDQNCVGSQRKSGVAQSRHDQAEDKRTSFSNPLGKDTGVNLKDRLRQALQAIDNANLSVAEAKRLGENGHQYISRGRHSILYAMGDAGDGERSAGFFVG